MHAEHHDEAAEPPQPQPDEARRVTLPSFYGRQDESFEDWAFHLNSYLRIHHLNGVTKGTDTSEPHSNRVFDILALHCKDAALRVLREVEDGNGRAAWEALHDVFAGKRTVRESALQTELFTRKWRADDTVATYRLDILRIRRSLLDMGEKSVIPDRAIRNFIAAHLPRDKFGLVVQAALNDNTELNGEEEKANYKIRPLDRVEVLMPKPMDEAVCVL